MQFLSAIYLALSLAAIGVLAWFALDMRSILRASQRKNQLSIEGRWKELDEHFKRTSNTWRPFARLQSRYLLPGTIQVQHALFLYKQGRFEEALTKVDQAIRWLKGKPQIFRSIHRSATFKTLCGALKTRTLIFAGMGRYDEARQTAAELKQMGGSDTSPNSSLALLEFHCGQLDEALSLAQAVSREDAQFDAMRGIAALVLCAKGEFDQAIQSLMYEPGDVSRFYSPEGLKLVSGSPEGARLIELQNKKLAGVFQPARLIILAKVHIARKDFSNADLALDQAEKKLGPEPGIQMSYCRYRACSLAAQGKAAEAQDYIQRMQAIVKQLPKRSLRWETHFATGQSYLYLERFGDALTELAGAQQLALHPIEKHSTAYWIARTHGAAGDGHKAIPYYQTVAADPIPSWMRKNAIEVLAEQKN